jgi:cell division protein FtsB
MTLMPPTGIQVDTGRLVSVLQRSVAMLTQENIMRTAAMEHLEAENQALKQELSELKTANKGEEANA